MYPLWPSLARQETQVPRAMKGLRTAVKITAESAKEIKNMNFRKVLVFN